MQTKQLLLVSIGIGKPIAKVYTSCNTLEKKLTFLILMLKFKKIVIYLLKSCIFHPKDTNVFLLLIEA